MSEKILSLEEIKQIELGILEYLHQVCENMISNILSILELY